MFFTVTTVVQMLTGSLKKDKTKDGLKYDKVIRLTSVNSPAFIPPSGLSAQLFP